MIPSEYRGVKRNGSFGISYITFPWRILVDTISKKRRTKDL